MANYSPNYNLYLPSRNDSDVEVDTSLTTNFTNIDNGLANHDAQLSDNAQHLSSHLNFKTMGAKGDGVNDDTPILTSILTNNIYPKIYVPDGTYIIKNLTILNQNAEFLFESRNAIFVFADNNDLVFESDYTNIVTVTSATSTNNTATVVVSDASGFSIGDVVKIVSEDAISGTDSSNTNYTSNYGGAARSGEIHTIYAISGNTLTLDGALINTYITSPRIGKQGLHSLKMTGGSIQWANSSSIIPIFIQGGMYHDIDLKINDNFYGTGIKTQSTFKSSINMIIGRSDSNSYGSYDSGSHLLGISYRSKTIRHPWTTGASGSISNTNLIYYGFTTYATIENCEVDGTTVAAFDCHVQAYHLTYRNGKAINNTNKVLQDRGDGNQYENLILDGDNGIALITEYRNTSRYSYLTGCTIGKWISVSGGSSSIIKQVLFKDCTFNLSITSTFQYSDVTFDSCTFYIGNTYLESLGNANFKFINCTFTFTTYNSSRVQLLEGWNGDYNAVLINCNFINNTGQAQMLNGFRNNTVSGGVFANSSVSMINTYVDPSFTLNGTVNDFNRWSGGQSLSASPNFKFTWNNNQDLTGSGAPTTTPPYIGARYLDIINNKLYVAFGTTSSANWIIMN